MRLSRLRIGRFREDQDLEIEFGQRPAADPSLTFLVGPNGAGKSRVLETVGRIFSHLSAGAAPGMDFDVEYSLRGRRVLITTRRPTFLGPDGFNRLEGVRAWLAVAGDETEEWSPAHIRDRWPADAELDDVLPFRVIGLSTGPTSRLDWALRRSLQESLAQRGDDSASSPGAGGGGEWEEAERDERLHQLRWTSAEARCIPLSGDELVLAVLALLSHPIAIGEEDDVRDELLERAGLSRDSLRAFSLDIAADWGVGLTAAHQQQFELLLSKAARRIALPPERPEQGLEIGDRDRRVVFELDSGLREWIGKTADRPFVWFNQLLNWLQSGAITSVRLVLTNADARGLLLDYDFSDGEFLLTGRYGLLQLLKDHRDCLVLFDEPETHFNDRWKVDLVYDLERVLAGTASQVVIATHSDLTLSDADRSDVQMLEPSTVGKVVPGQPPLSPLAADRGEIIRQIFGASRGSGKRGVEIVEDALRSGDRAQIEAALERVGPGFHRFRLQYALREEGEDAS